MTRPDFIRYAGGRRPEYVIKCNNGCGWFSVSQLVFVEILKCTGQGFNPEAVQCKCGAMVPYQEGRR